MSIWRKWAAATAELGSVNACWYAAHRALTQIGGAVHRYYFVAQPILAEPLLPPTRGRSITVQELAGSDPALQDMPLNYEVIRYRLAQHSVCLGAFTSDRMIGCLWLCLGPYQEDEVRGKFTPAPSGRASWDFDVYIAPEYRVGAAFARLWDEANRFLRERGIAWSISRISAYNPTSLAAHARLGTRRIGTATFVRLGSCQITLASLRPYVHLSLGPRSVPEFVLHAPSGATLTRGRMPAADSALSRRQL